MTSINAPTGIPRKQSHGEHLDGVSNIPFLGQTLKGSRFAVSHCCCDYPKVKDTQARRTQWDGYREAYRREWSERFGSWGKENGENSLYGLISCPRG
jgi:hypothetical protein